MANNKIVSKRVTNEEKVAVCEKYRDHLRIIHLFGNNVMLLKQLNQLSKELNLHSSQSMFQKQMNELLEYDIIKYEPFFVSNRVTQHKIIILKKFALRFLKGFTEPGGSQKVSPVPPLKSNDRILLATFKGSFLLQKVIPVVKKHKGIATLDLVLEYITKSHMSILTGKNKGLDYAKSYFSAFSKYLDKEFMRDQLTSLQTSLNKRKKGMERGSQSIEGKGKASIEKSGIAVKNRLDKSMSFVKPKNELFSRKEQQLVNYSFENMIRSNIQIVSIAVEDGPIKKMKVRALLFDYLNKRNLYSLAKKIACFYNMLNNSVNSDLCELHLEIGIISYDQESTDGLERDADEVVYSPFSGEEDSRLSLILRNWQVSNYQQLNRLKILYNHYDITNQYLEGKKLANLLQET